ncbi:hypothetical protein [Paracoccus sp. SCSIO 75233]|uniref:hypothetical protein n=1 Tax=Paracoccus sp. SCSIO 75233 TaxID=3017782 RepID=UPI0022EFE954|nr:hypothetical protein [Paracoccus sp. SCSIO 75233]WBU54301.1 hypothetical protein PAF12_05565 [Paracoccus sp. SCSIO 75233]
MKSIQVGFAIVGHPRCGSRSLATAFGQLGLKVGHEKLERDGIVSWWNTARYQGDHSFKDPRLYPSEFTSRVIGHYIRNPIDAIPSILIENQFRERKNNSYQFRQWILSKEFDVDLDEMSPLTAAATSFVLWNDLAAKISDLDQPILVERPDTRQLQAMLGGALPFTGKEIKLPRENTTARKFGVDKWETSREDIIDATPEAFRPRLDYYLSLYDFLM